jgi:hypothetical protein
MRIATRLKYSGRNLGHESKSGYISIGNYNPFFVFAMAEIGR